VPYDAVRLESQPQRWLFSICVLLIVAMCRCVAHTFWGLTWGLMIF